MAWNWSKLVAVSFALIVSLGAVPSAAQNWVGIETSDGSLPEARHENAFTAVGDSLVLAGGRGIKAVDLYDPAYNQWIKGAPPPFEIHHFQGVNVDGALWAVGASTGGFPDETPLPNAMIYDPEGDDWQEGPEIPADRRRGSAGAAIVDGMNYIAGGAIDGHRAGHVAWLDRLDPSTGEWTRLTDAPRARDHGALIAWNNTLIFVGGRLSIAPENTFGAVIPEVDVYDIATDTWQTLKVPLPSPRAGIAAALIDDGIYVIGGESGETGNAYANVDRLDLLSWTWKSAPPLLRARHGTSATVFDGAIWIVAGSGARGGASELNSMERLQVP